MLLRATFGPRAVCCACLGWTVCTYIFSKVANSPKGDRSCLENNVFIYVFKLCNCELCNKTIINFFNFMNVFFLIFILYNCEVHFFGNASVKRLTFWQTIKNSLKQCDAECCKSLIYFSYLIHEGRGVEFSPLVQDGNVRRIRAVEWEAEGERDGQN